MKQENMIILKVEIYFHDIQNISMNVDFQEMELKPWRTMFFPLLRRKFDEMGDIFDFSCTSYLVGW